MVKVRLWVDIEFVITGVGILIFVCDFDLIDSILKEHLTRLVTWIFGA